MRHGLSCRVKQQVPGFRYTAADDVQLNVQDHSYGGDGDPQCLSSLRQDLLGQCISLSSQASDQFSCDRLLTLVRMPSPLSLEGASVVAGQPGARRVGFHATPGATRTQLTVPVQGDVPNLSGGIVRTTI